MHRMTIWLALLSVGSCASAESYLEIIPVFWKNLYPQGGQSLYCGDQFARFDRRYNLEHVFPMAWVARSLDCGRRQQCRRSSALFNQIESDMHNLYPVQARLNKARAAMAYAEMRGEDWVSSDCDLEIDPQRRRVEPRPAVRGNIARAMLYMADTYPELKLYPRQRALMLRWHQQDPVDAQERQRNQTITRLQKRSNPWIRKEVGADHRVAG